MLLRILWDQGFGFAITAPMFSAKRAGLTGTANEAEFQPQYLTFFKR